MLKRLISMVLAIILLASVALPVFAVETEETEEKVQYVYILNLKNLETLAENCRLDSYSRNIVVSLRTDLNLEGCDFTGIPVFCGKFEGNGHTIRGLDLTQEGSAQGFFRYLTDTAVVQNLHLEGEVHLEGSAAEIGGLVGKNSGTVRNCSFTGDISGKEFVGGIAGHNTLTAVIQDCKVSGHLTGDHFVGGIAGKNAGVIRNCTNEATINDTPQQNTVELSDISLDSALQSESVSTVTDIGGIAGNSTGLIRDCKNFADIGYISMGYNIGGIVGTQSGTVQNCDNYGSVFGRKEIGGIAGQMEPSAVMNFEEDVLQILTRQLSGMGSIVSDAASNVQSTGEAIIGQVSNMHYHVTNAKDAVAQLIPDKDSGDILPDADSIQAAKNGLSASFNGMSQAINGISATAYSALGAVSSNLQDMNDQINAMRNTISNADETLGGSIVDMSDEDTEEDFTGKVADCRNFGSIHADLNGGGITGAIAMENDADVEEDLLITGNNSLNFESEIRAVVRNCENNADIVVRKQYAGGIVGQQTLGLVKNSRNFGKLDAANADYVGGISGSSMGFIRGSHANGEIYGNTYVGGIAGSATIATGCYSLVRIQDSKEKTGAILGFQEEDINEVENPVAENYYLPVFRDIGAIDGISYADKAQAMAEQRFFLLEDIPARFAYAVITFRYDDDTIRKFTIDFGSVFPEDWVPSLHPKDGRQTYWDGLDQILKTGVFFDVQVHQEYTSQISVLESADRRGEIPLMLVQGVFSEDAHLSVEAMESSADYLSDEEILLEAWSFVVSQPDGQSQLRLQLPESADPEKISIRILGMDGIWRTEAHDQSGRYAVVALNPYDSAVALIQEKSPSWVIPAVVIACAGILAGIVWLGYSKKKKAQ